MYLIVLIVSDKNVQESDKENRFYQFNRCKLILSSSACPNFYSKSYSP